MPQINFGIDVDKIRHPSRTPTVVSWSVIARCVKPIEPAFRRSSSGVSEPSDAVVCEWKSMQITPLYYPHQRLNRYSKCIGVVVMDIATLPTETPEMIPDDVLSAAGQLRELLASGTSPIYLSGHTGIGKSTVVTDALSGYQEVVRLVLDGVVTSEGLLARLALATGSATLDEHDVLKRIENRSCVLVVDQLDDLMTAGRTDAINLLKMICAVPGVRVVLVAAVPVNIDVAATIEVSGIPLEDAQTMIGSHVASTAVDGLYGIPRILKMAAPLAQIDANSLFHSIRREIAAMPAVNDKAMNISRAVAMQVLRRLSYEYTDALILHGVLSASACGVPAGIIDAALTREQRTKLLQPLLDSGVVEAQAGRFIAIGQSTEEKRAVRSSDVFERLMKASAATCERILDHIAGGHHGPDAIQWLDGAGWYIAMAVLSDGSAAGRQLRQAVPRLLSHCGCQKEADALAVRLQSSGQYISDEDVAWQTLHLVESGLRRSKNRPLDALLPIFSNETFSNVLRATAGMVLADAYLHQDKPEFARQLVVTVLEIGHLDARTVAKCYWLQARAIRARDGGACSVEPFVKARTAALGANDLPIVSACAVAISTIHAANGNPRAAAEVLVESYDLLRESDDDKTKAILLRRVARVMEGTGELEQAGIVAFQAYTHAITAGSVELAATLCQMMLVYAVECAAVPMALAASYLSQQLRMAPGSPVSIMSTQVGAMVQVLQSSDIDLGMPQSTGEAMDTIGKQVDIWRTQLRLERGGYRAA